MPRPLHGERGVGVKVRLPLAIGAQVEVLDPAARERDEDLADLVEVAVGEGDGVAVRVTVGVSVGVAVGVAVGVGAKASQPARTNRARNVTKAARRYNIKQNS